MEEEEDAVNEEEEEEVYSGANAVNEENPERDRTTQEENERMLSLRE